MGRKYTGAQKTGRKRALARMRDGDPCGRCGGAMAKDDPGGLEWDHLDDGSMSLSHFLCNRRAGGQLSAIMAGKTLKGQVRPPSAQCVICGKAIRPSVPTTPTCGQQSCVTQLRRSRKAFLPDPAPPVPSGRVW